MSFIHHTEEERLMERLERALSGVTLSAHDRLMLRFIAGYGPEIAIAMTSLFDRQALAHGATEPPSVRAAYDARRSGGAR